ncbi:4Fe-4S dicluster domain-containing protein [Zooshikella harenae]|uniref:4Fe-4S dicluster domain-containing protein n=1 Tax=Zooshikella harenae TaxID=2827238 RepID=A0ABS5ZGC8_9GAMM|nr:4Fe-4S dicluster domain-containing protein [Zooshikella harenae]MBU2712305.1 4Fe-4S dicluster domain-containing protein [Zooshikella harenae]
MIKHFLARQHLDQLFSVLSNAGYQVVGPTVKDNAIVFTELSHVEQLPWGRQEIAKPGHYQLTDTSTNRCFAWNTGPQGLKPWLFKPEQPLWQAEQTEQGLCFRQASIEAHPIAVIGLRGCDLAALKLQDQHFLQGPYPDPYYQAQREQLFIIAVNCAQSAETCFCVSTGDGPEATHSFDLVLDELEEGYLMGCGSEQGQAIFQQLTLGPQVSKDQLHTAQKQLADASQQQRQMPDEDSLLKLTENLEHPQWQDVADRCLACGNCTLVCPTCFCSKQESTSDIKLQQAEQVRLWDSCFSEQHGYIAGKLFRPEIRHRYRQWLLHKLANWQQQYGRSGCVGCGRCISWCPVGIDLVAEAQILVKGTPHEPTDR